MERDAAFSDLSAASPITAAEQLSPAAEQKQPNVIDRFLKKRRRPADGGTLADQPPRVLPLPRIFGGEGMPLWQRGDARQPSAEAAALPLSIELDTPEPEAVESTVEPAPAPETAALVRRWHRLGEHTLHVVAATHENLTTAAAQPEVASAVSTPELVQLDEAAEDVDEALTELDQAKATSAEPAAKEVSVTPAEAPAPPSEVAGTQPAPPPEYTAIGWADKAADSAARAARSLAVRLERQVAPSRRALSSAELGVVAALFGGALGLIFVAERRAAKKEQRAAKKKIQQTELTIAKQEAQIAQQEVRLDALQQQAHQAPPEASNNLAEPRRHAREVAVFAHHQADTIREVAVQVGQEHNPTTHATTSQNEHQPKSTHASSVPERPPLAPGAHVEPEKQGILERLKPLVGLDTAERFRPQPQLTVASVKAGVAGALQKAGRASPIIATKVQNFLSSAPVSHIAHSAKNAAKDGELWFYGVVLCTAVAGFSLLVWLLVH